MACNNSVSMDLAVFNLPTHLVLQINCLLHELSIE